MALGENSSAHIIIALAIIGLLGIVTLALTAATMGIMNKQYNQLDEEVKVIHERINDLDNRFTTTTTTTTTSTTPPPPGNIVSTSENPTSSPTGSTSG